MNFDIAARNLFPGEPGSQLPRAHRRGFRLQVCKRSQLADQLLRRIALPQRAEIQITLSLAEPAPVRRNKQRKVAVFHRRKAQRPLQPDLPRRRGQQIPAADDLRHAAFCVVRHHGQLISVDAVGAADNKIPAVPRQILRIAALQAVMERDLFFWDPDAPRGPPRLLCTLLRCQVPAGPGVDRSPVRRMRR